MIKDNSILITFLKKLEDAGYKVYVAQHSINEITFAKFVKDDKIGYTGKASFGFGVDISTVHKPSGEFGTSFSITENFLLGTTEPTIELAQKALDSGYYYNNKPVPKYKSWEDYLSYDRHFKWIEFNSLTKEK